MIAPPITTISMCARRPRHARNAGIVLFRFAATCPDLGAIPGAAIKDGAPVGEGHGRNPSIQSHGSTPALLRAATDCPRDRSSWFYRQEGKATRGIPAARPERSRPGADSQDCQPAPAFPPREHGILHHYGRPMSQTVRTSWQRRGWRSPCTMPVGRCSATCCRSSRLRQAVWCASFMNGTVPNCVRFVGAHPQAARPDWARLE
jgi:hypothetical protein